MILSCHHISKSFLEVPVLTDVTFHLEKGEKAAIVGINGAGKSTLLKIITGEMKSDEGTVSVSKESRAPASVVNSSSFMHDEKVPTAISAASKRVVYRKKTFILKGRKRWRFFSNNEK